MTAEEDPLRPHSHDPNPAPPSSDPAFYLRCASGSDRALLPSDLAELPFTTVDECYIVSTGHGTSGPFVFGGSRLGDLIARHCGSDGWTQVEVVSADGFGTRIGRSEIVEKSKRPILLAYRIDGEILSREDGLVRLIVPSETDDALRQVKWVSEIRVRA